MSSPQKSSSWEQTFVDQAAGLHSIDRFRSRRIVRPTGAVTVEVDGQSLVNFCSNDYLGLSHHPRVVSAAVEAARVYGIGSGAAPLITGYTPAHASAEAAIARWKQTESAVLFSSGYQANISLIQALTAIAENAGRPVRFLLDKLCHASLIDAVRSVSTERPQGAGYRVFPHNGYEKLARLLDADDGAYSEPAPLQVIVTESIFSMDGDAADLSAITSLKTPQTLLVVDEAHGSGVYGTAGGGLGAELGLTRHIDATIVTLSKAAGVIGAAVCGSKALCDAVVNFGRGYIFSTSMPAVMAAAAEAAITVMRDEPERQQRLRAISTWVRQELVDAGISLPPGDSPILPILLGTEKSAKAAAAAMFDAGLLVMPIRPPTVPRGTSRLRVTLSSEHSDAQLEQLVATLKGVVAQYSNAEHSKCEP